MMDAVELAFAIGGQESTARAFMHGFENRQIWSTFIAEAEPISPT